MGAIEDHGYTFKADLSGEAADGYVKRRDGAVVGELNTMYDDGTDTYVVLMSILHGDVPKGKGIGADLYTRLADEIKRKTGKRLSSEKKLQSPSASKMWQRLVSQGQAQGPVKMGSKEMYVTEKRVTMLEVYGLKESADLLSQFEDTYPDGLCPKKWIIKLFKTHGMPDADAAWTEYAQETGAAPHMPEQVEWQPVLSWMGY